MFDQIKKHKGWIVFGMVVLIFGIPLAIHVLFKIQAPTPFLEAKWTAGDVLGYYGSVLSFLGTATISLVAVFISQDLAEKSRRRQEDKQNQKETIRKLQELHERDLQKWQLEEQRKKDIQPIFSVEITGTNVQPSGTAEPFSIYKPETIPKHENIKISIKNTNLYPVLHIVAFNKYLCQMLESGKNITAHCTYWNTTDAKTYHDKMIILTDDFERDNAGHPKSFIINYQDIDGNEMYQVFDLKEFDGTKYYSLAGIFEV